MKPDSNPPRWNSESPVNTIHQRSFLIAWGLSLLVCLSLLPPAGAQPSHPSQSFNISALQQGEFFLLAKKPDEALKIFEALWKREPQNSYAVRGVVRAYQALGKLPEVVTMLKGYLGNQSQSSSASYGLGYAYYLEGRFEESRKLLDEALALNPENVLALNNLAAVLAEFKDYTGALEKAHEAIRIDPRELILFRNLQMIYAESGKTEKFEEEYRYLLKEGFLIKAKGFGLVLAQQLRQKSFGQYAGGKIDESIHTIGEMLNIYREVDHQPGIVAGLFSLAVLYEEQGKSDLALEKYREVLKINPQHIQAREKERLLSPKKD